jgi:Concanavalin A-like lectin/glucanases superfamily/Planctomycete cytochrome C
LAKCGRLIGAAVVFFARSGAAQQFFDERVEPILSRHCLGCHNDESKQGGVSFMGRDGLVREDPHGTVVRPGKPDSSLLIQALRHGTNPHHAIAQDDVATLTGWVAQGAEWGTKLRAGEFWRFDRLDRLGPHASRIVGQPRLIEAPFGKAVEFDGKGDALLVETHPLAGADKFTWEVLFRPDAGGAAEQRFFNLQERDPKTGEDTRSRLLLEIRVTPDGWFLDSVAQTAGNVRILFNKDHVHPFGPWYHVALVYDGRECRNYVDGVLENSGEVRLGPHTDGHSSAGVRINLRYYFKGAIAFSKMTRRALAPGEFAKLPLP